MIATKAVGGGQIRSELLRHPTWASSLAGDLSNLPRDLDLTIATVTSFARNILSWFRDPSFVHSERTCMLDSMFLIDDGVLNDSNDQNVQKYQPFTAKVCCIRITKLRVLRDLRWWSNIVNIRMLLVDVRRMLRIARQKHRIRYMR